MMTRRIGRPGVRRTALGVVLALGLAGVVRASDYVVVASTDPAHSRGKGLDAGARLALAPGRTLTVMHASGNVLTFKGAAAGVVLPKRSVSQAEADRMNLLKVMVSPNAPKRATSGFGRTRAGVCPLPADLTDLDQIAGTHARGCTSEAATALDAYIAARVE